MNARQFGRTVEALAQAYAKGMQVGTEWSFMVPSTYFDVEVWIAAEGIFVLQLRNEHGKVERTVAIVRGEYRHFEIISRQVVLAEANDVKAAFSTALDYVTAPARAAQQSEPDPVGV